MKKWHYLFISVLIIGLDQFSKNIAVNNLAPYLSLAVFPYLNFTLMFNTGSAFSFLSNAGNWHVWFFLAFSFIMSIVILVWMFKTSKAEVLQLTSLALILGGAIGNLVDRIHYGHVVDFIDFYYKQYHWPAFNLADSAILIGVVIFLSKRNS